MDRPNRRVVERSACNLSKSDTESDANQQNTLWWLLPATSLHVSPRRQEIPIINQYFPMTELFGTSGLSPPLQVYLPARMALTDDLQHASHPRAPVCHLLTVELTVSQN